jgi:two-component system sensor histidine kinase SenX3
MVNGNAALLKRALAEPIRNAAAYSPQGSAVTVSCAQDGGHAIVVIADQGIGMTPMDRDSAFDRYFRSRDVRVRAVYGHGIGLTLARQIVAAHGGTIALDSIPDAGTTVTIRLPLALPG